MSVRKSVPPNVPTALAALAALAALVEVEPVPAAEPVPVEALPAGVPVPFVGRFVCVTACVPLINMVDS
jgi:hypothetical protein